MAEAKSCQVHEPAAGAVSRQARAGEAQGRLGQAQDALAGQPQGLLAGPRQGGSELYAFGMCDFIRYIAVICLYLKMTLVLE